MSSVSSAEPTAQQNFNPSWMRPNAANRGGPISSGGHRLSGIGGGGFDDVGDDVSSSSVIAAAAAAVLSTPVASEYSYTRERLLELVSTGAKMPEALRDQLFFNEKNLPLVSNTPLSDLEQKLQHNINSSKAMSLLSHADRASIAAGAAYGSGYGGGLATSSPPATQTAQTPNRWTPKSSWSMNKPSTDRPVGLTTRGGGSVGRAGGTFFAGRGGGRIGTENGFSGATNGGSSAGQTEDSPGSYQSKFNAIRRGGGAGSVGRGGSTTGASFNTRADALYNPNDPTDRPKPASTAPTRSESDDEEEEGWSKVGSTTRTSTNTATSSERPAWARSESWIQRTQQQQQQQQQQTNQQPSQPTNNWNNRESGSDSAVWRDRHQMVAAAKKTSAENPPSQQLPPQQQQPPSVPSTVSPREEVDASDVPVTNYHSSSSTWSNSGTNGSMGVFYQPSQAASPPKEAPVEFFYLDPSEVRRGGFPKEQMMVWFKAGYFNDESLRIQRGEYGEFKTIGELKILNGATTPFDYLEDTEKARPAPAMPTMPAYPPSSNPIFPAGSQFGNMGLWSSMGQTNEMMTLMQSTFEQQMLAERQRLVEEHNRRMQEETEKLQKFQEAMYRQLTLQQEVSQQQIREQEIALQRHREELEKRDAELKREALARQHQMEMEARELEHRKAAIEAEDRRKREMEERIMQEEQQKKEAVEKLRRAEEAAEKERIRLEAASRESEMILRNNRLAAERIQREREEEEKRQVVADRERIARESAAAAAASAAAARQQAELEAVWTSKKAPVVSTSSAPVSSGAPKQVSPSGSDDSEGWTSISKEVKHTKAAPWAAKSESPQKTEKTLLEIQLEEERKLKAEQDQKAKLKAKEQSVPVSVAATVADKSGGLWGASKTWAAPESNSSSKSFVSPFLDGPSLEAANKMALQKKNSQAKIVVNSKPAATVSSKTKVAPAVVPTPKVKKSKEETAADELQQWFVKRFQQFSVAVDSLTLFDCILTLENPNEVEDIVMSYLDESKTVKEFVREFIKRRIAMRAAGGARPEADDLTSARTAAAAPSDTNSGSNANSGNGQGKKKKKSQKQVLDGNILGFRGAAASDRLNKGEIDAIPTAPVNPSRR